MTSNLWSQVRNLLKSPAALAEESALADRDPQAALPFGARLKKLNHHHHNNN
jgi:hypothetical protein